MFSLRYECKFPVNGMKIGSIFAGGGISRLRYWWRRCKLQPVSLYMKIDRKNCHTYNCAEGLCHFICSKPLQKQFFMIRDIA